MQLKERQNNQLLQMEKHQEEASRLRYSQMWHELSTVWLCPTCGVLVLCLLGREEVERLNIQLKREAIKSYRYQAFSDRFVEHIQAHSRKAGKVSLSCGCMAASFFAVY